MVDPADTVTQALPGVEVVADPMQDVALRTQFLSEWYVMVGQLKKLKDAEMTARKRIFAWFFPEPKEGTNTAPLPDQWVIKGKYPIARDLDIGAFNALRPQMEKLGVNIDTLVEYKPALKVAVYRELTEEQQKMFDRCLIIKPGSPGLEIELPAKARKAQAAPAAITLNGQAT